MGPAIGVQNIAYLPVELIEALALIIERHDDRNLFHIITNIISF